ncbi:MAG: transporter substrate-binding domain-containing protein [Lachnospiraceae bacterium]
MKKRLVSAVLAGLMAVSVLTGCGTGGAESKEDTKEPAATTAADSGTADADTSDAEGPACQDALKGVALNVGTSGTYAPFSYFAEDGVTLQGFDVDFLYELQGILGFEISGDAISDMDYGPLTTSLTSNQLDIGAAALCATDERKKNMNFTETYYDAGIIVAVAEDNDTITCVEDLESGDYTVAVQTGTIAYEYASANLPESCLQAYDAQTLAYKAVEGGQADATIYDAPGTSYAIKSGEVKLKIVGDEFYNGQAPYAIALSFNICDKYPDIVDNFNAAIDYLTETGKIDEIKAKWCE